ncbi:hypothetical protein OEZ85_006962 [Tetradesmus obliquus]|uniref:Uncharacterized protein n=1 Tax=Tetradesmus obliquus TaxID=3088 RepID=A0ABY8TYN7_TETOB|nr:hypothetical protein OEZ85_006962 [Tetradesmus obliquus]
MNTNRMRLAVSSERIDKVGRLQGGADFQEAARPFNTAVADEFATAVPFATPTDKAVPLPAELALAEDTAFLPADLASAVD